MCAAINLAPALARRSPQQGLLVAAALAVQGLRRARRREVAVRGRRVAVRGLAAAALALVRVRAEAVDLAPVLVVDQGVAVLGHRRGEGQVDHPEEGGVRQHAVGPRLVHGPDALDLELLRDALEAAVQPVDLRHHELDVEDAREVDVEQLEELLLRRRQRGARQDFEEIPKIITRVERDPFHFINQNEAGHHDQLPEALHVDALGRVAVKINPRLLQELDGVLGVAAG